MLAEWTYCHDCYFGGEVYPFSFCKKCWIKAGRPKAMWNGEEE